MAGKHAPSKNLKDGSGRQKPVRQRPMTVARTEKLFLEWLDCGPMSRNEQRVFDLIAVMVVVGSLLLAATLVVLTLT
jgi:hypothetical protein